MIAEELINYMIPPLNPGDDIGKAKQWMDELRQTQLPVIDQQNFLGIITEDMLFDSNLQFAEVGQYPLIGTQSKVTFDAHYYDILKVSVAENVKIVAIVDENDHYAGVVSQEDVVHAFAQSSSVHNPGAILMLRLNAIDYSLSEISRVIESNQAKILASYVSVDEQDPNNVLLTLKINTDQEVHRIVASLGNQGFQVESSYGNSQSSFDEKERLDIFMKYLKI